MMWEVPAGTMVLKEGEVNMDMYRIMDGHAELYVGYQTPSETILGILSKGAYFGELGMLTQKPSIYTVVAYSNMKIFRLAPDDLEDYFGKNPSDAISIMRHMADSMYNLKFNMDMLLKELGKKQSGAAAQIAYIRKQIAKYNMGGIPAARESFRS